jgi:hypothetical protein
VIQRFLFDGINAITAGAAIGGEYNLVIQVLPHKAQSALVRVQFAEAWTEVALYPAIFQRVPVSGADGELIALGHRLSPYLRSAELRLPDNNISRYTALS